MSIVLMGTTSGSITLQEPAVAGSTVLELPASSGTVALGNQLGLRNRIINGAMVIDQRNAGASVTPTTSPTYTLDRWAAAFSVTSKFSVQQNAGSVTPPAGFTNYLGVTSLSAYTVGAAENFLIQQRIEGFNVADLGWGTANAQTVTLSFYVRSSLTGTFGGSLRNIDNTRTYPFSYTISAANTWEYKTVTIAGDTTGTWAKNNTLGINLTFSLGSGSTFSGTAGAWVAGNFVSATGSQSVVGTNGATFYITGVQLEKGSQATSFEYRQYGQELALCQRYYYRIFPNANPVNLTGAGICPNTTSGSTMVGSFPVTMRTAPTALEQSGTASHYRINLPGVVSAILNAVPTFSAATSEHMYAVNGTVASGLTAGYPAFLQTNNIAAYLGFSAEL
jgi:hypothetical protein